MKKLYIGDNFIEIRQAIRVVNSKIKFLKTRLDALEPGSSEFQKPQQKFAEKLDWLTDLLAWLELHEKDYN